MRRRGRQPHVAARAEEYEVGELREETEGVKAGRGRHGDQEHLQGDSIMR